MTIYTVHLPRADVGLPAAAERMQLVPDRFSGAAFLFGPLWCLSVRAWLGLFVWIVGAACIAALYRWVGAPPAVVFGTAFLGCVLMGLEAASFRRLALRHRGFRLSDLVAGNSYAEAEQRAIVRLTGAQNPDAALSATRPPPVAPTEGLVGIFPHAGA